MAPSSASPFCARLERRGKDGGSKRTIDLLQLLVDTVERVQTIMEGDMWARVCKNGEDGDRITANMGFQPHRQEILL
jgi:hypothetical protein